MQRTAPNRLGRLGWPKRLVRLAMSASGCVGAAARFKQEPSAPLGLVDQSFQQTRCSAVLETVAQFVCLAHLRGAVLVVADELGQHVERIDSAASLSLTRSVPISPIERTVLWPSFRMRSASGSIDA